MKKIIKFVCSRLFLTSFVFFLQILIIYVGLRYIEQFEIFSVSSVALGLITSLLVFSRDDTQEYKLSWIFLILLLPLFGTLLYIIFGNKKHKVNKELLRSHHKKVGTLINSTILIKNQDKEVLDSDDDKLLCTYIEKNADGYLFSDTEITYYPLADMVFYPLLNALNDAKKFILMEFFIMDKGMFLNSVISILKRKVSEGVQVMVLYDDMGSINTLPKNFYLYLRSMGIMAVAFNPVKVGLSPRLNYRDHRKMCIIDGNKAFSGGINIADEYINRKIRFGHWKDNAYLVHGSGVFNYTVMFLQLWNFSAPDEYTVDDYSIYLPILPVTGNSLIQSYGDSPLEDENVAENVYILTINSAKKYLWLSTPYLILDTKMIDALSLAAKSGVDVRIITPSIPDKKIVFNMTQSNYSVLLKNGIKIFEYIPGFIHTKMFVSDDKIALVGTANMDFRSFYLHFECGSVFYGGKTVQDVKNDFLNTFKYCKIIPDDYPKTVGFIKRLFRLFLRIIAPML